MTCSVVIPCIPRHFDNLGNIINAFKAGTKQPDEVIVALSESGSISQDKLDHLVSLCVKLVHIPEVGSSARNRQNGSNVATGDIIIYQDADDLPHPRRVEVINWFFEISDIVHLNHSYYKGDTVPLVDQIKAVKSETLFNTYFPHGIFEECKGITTAYGGDIGFVENGVGIPIHAGAVAIRREVLKQVKWREASEMVLFNYYRFEDYEFCMEVLYKFKKSLVIDAKLYQYN